LVPNIIGGIPPGNDIFMVLVITKILIHSILLFFSTS